MKTNPAEIKEFLNSCDLDKRIRLISADLKSGKDKYRCLDAFELAELLEVTIPPDGSWSFYREHFIDSIEDYVHSHGGVEEMIEEISSSEASSILDECHEGMPISTACVTDEFYSDLFRRFSSSGVQLLKKLSKDEIDAIRLACAYNDYTSARDNGLGGRATYRITSDDADIVFDATLEDDGGCIEMDSPYDFRDYSKKMGSTKDHASFREDW